MTNLTLLTLESNELKSISPELGRLTLLTEFSIAHNALEAIPVSIYYDSTPVAYFFARLSAARSPNEPMIAYACMLTHVSACAAVHRKAGEHDIAFGG